ncbi:hypothetical protein BDN72DRAFT_896321 [Pluteus cervinus]|uniref:Uncharacterized protein n=1 Tax=Pluteus cervinus TaxID=181527 RepID=A0ACD3AZ90_9AGAR|nr:hypothetical protein BDN72DRAFT_896321 [Pluteus cervinus]
MQLPTCTGIRVRSPSDAHVIFHAVGLGLLPIVSRRLDTEERRRITSGNVFVWEERGPNAEATGLGIERWTDSIRWGPSRVRDEFLYYHERDTTGGDLDVTSDSDTTSPSHSTQRRSFLRDNLVKQTYSVFVETPRGRRKWHLIAYFTPDSLDYLRTVDDIPELANVSVPPGQYTSARSTKWNRAPRTMDRFHHHNPQRKSPYPSATPQPPHAPSYLTNGQPHPPPYTPYDIANDANYSPPSPASGLGLKPPQPRPLSHHIPFAPSPGRPPRTGLTNDLLAPLAYLENIPPPRRHPLDEKALMSFNPGFR